MHFYYNIYFQNRKNKEIVPKSNKLRNKNRNCGLNPYPPTKAGFLGVHIRDHHDHVHN